MHKKFLLMELEQPFHYPLIDTWRVEYQKVNPDVNLNYASIGSGGGIKQFTEKTVDFGASDAPLSETEFQKAGSPVHIPETLGSVVFAYNIPDVTTSIKFTGPSYCRNIFRKNH